MVKGLLYVGALSQDIVNVEFLPAVAEVTELLSRSGQSVRDSVTFVSTV